MSGEESNDVRIRARDERSASRLVDCPSTHDFAMLEELRFVRREAQAEANLAYDEWRRRPCADAYAVYLAAQDRADAAQDELADCSRRVPRQPRLPHSSSRP